MWAIFSFYSVKNILLLLNKTYPTLEITCIYLPSFTYGTDSYNWRSLTFLTTTHTLLLTCDVYPFTRFQQFFILVPHYLRNRVPIDITWNWDITSNWINRSSERYIGLHSNCMEKNTIKPLNKIVFSVCFPLPVIVSMQCLYN